MSVYTDAFWWDLHNEIALYLENNGFDYTKYQILIDTPKVQIDDNKPIITFDWVQNDGGDLADGGQTIDRNKSCNSVIFVSVFNGDAVAQGILSSLDTYKTQNYMQRALYDWMTTTDNVTYPISKWVESAPFTARNTTAKIYSNIYTGVSFDINFNYKINNGV